MRLLERLKAYPEGVGDDLAEKFRRRRIQEGETKALAKIAIRLLTKRFDIKGDTRAKIEKLDAVNLEIIIDEILEYKSIEDIDKYLKE